MENYNTLAQELSKFIGSIENCPQLNEQLVRNPRFNCILNGNNYSYQKEPLILLAPIFQIHEWVIHYNTLVLESEDAMTRQLVDAVIHTVAHDRNLEVTMILTNYIDHAHTLMESIANVYTEVKSTAIQAVYKNAMGAYEDSSLDSAARDLTTLHVYKHCNTNSIIILSNYCLQKNYRNNNGIKNVQNMSDINAHITIGLTPILFPEFKKDLTDVELEIFKRYSNPAKIYTDRDIYELYSTLFKTETYSTAIRDQRKNALKRLFILRQEQSYTNKIETYKSLLQSHMQDIANIERELLKAEKDFLYYQYSPTETNSWSDYLFNHPYIYDVDTTHSEANIRLALRLPLQQWDPELAEMLYDNILNRQSIEMPVKKEIKEFIKNILLDQVGTYWVVGLIDLNISDFSFNMLKLQEQINFGETGYRNYLTNIKAGINPHLEAYRCIGTYAAQITKAQHAKDFVGFLECLFAPYKCWNLADGAVSNTMFDKFLPLLLKYNIPCVEYAGEMLDISTFNKKIRDLNAPKVEEPAPKKRAPRKTKAVLEAVMTNTTLDPLGVQGVQGVPGIGDDAGIQGGAEPVEGVEL